MAVAPLSFLSTFSLLPLLPARSAETIVKWALFVAGHAVELSLLCRCCCAGHGPFTLLKVGPIPGVVVALCVVALGLYTDCGFHTLLFGPNRMEFLPLLMVSDFCAILVLGSFARLYVLVAAPNCATFRVTHGDSGAK